MKEELDMEEKIILEDENGVAREFDLEVSFPLGEKTYVLLTEGEESDDVFAFFIDEDEDGEILVPWCSNCCGDYFNCKTSNCLLMHKAIF